jgi:hypothetical protein
MDCPEMKAGTDISLFELYHEIVAAQLQFINIQANDKQMP